MRLFRILFAFDALAFLALLYFFIDGLRYATAGGDYFSTWALLLAVPAAVLALAWALKGQGKVGGANVLLGLLAAPFVLYGLFIGLFLVTSPDFK